MSLFGIPELQSSLTDPLQEKLFGKGAIELSKQNKALQYRIKMKKLRKKQQEAETQDEKELARGQAEELTLKTTKDILKAQKEGKKIDNDIDIEGIPSQAPGRDFERLAEAGQPQREPAHYTKAERDSYQRPEPQPTGILKNTTADDAFSDTMYGEPQQEGYLGISKHKEGLLPYQIEAKKFQEAQAELDSLFPTDSPKGNLGEYEDEALMMPEDEPQKAPQMFVDDPMDKSGMIASFIKAGQQEKQMKALTGSIMGDTEKELSRDWDTLRALVLQRPVAKVVGGSQSKPKDYAKMASGLNKFQRDSAKLLEETTGINFKEASKADQEGATKLVAGVFENPQMTKGNFIGLETISGDVIGGLKRVKDFFTGEGGERESVSNLKHLLKERGQLSYWNRFENEVKVSGRRGPARTINFQSFKSVLIPLVRSLGDPKPSDRDLQAFNVILPFLDDLQGVLLAAGFKGNMQIDINFLRPIAGLLNNMVDRSLEKLKGSKSAFDNMKSSKGISKRVSKVFSGAITNKRVNALKLRSILNTGLFDAYGMEAQLLAHESIKKGKRLGNIRSWTKDQAKKMLRGSIGVGFLRDKKNKSVSSVPGILMSKIKELKARGASKRELSEFRKNLRVVNKVYSDPQRWLKVVDNRQKFFQAMSYLSYYLE